MKLMGIRLWDMRKKIVCVSFLIIIVLFISACIYRYKMRLLYTETVLFASHDEDDINYRIPGIVTLNSGGMIAYCEKRVGKADWGDIDIVYRISEDGVHWGRETVLAGSMEECTYNNPIMIVDDRDVVHCIFCKEYGVGSLGGVYYVRSENGGIDWSSPVDISENTLPDYRNVIATGPGHGICLQDGTLIIPVWMVPKECGQEEKAHHPAVVSTLYSRDYGDAWDIGEILTDKNDIDPNEGTLVELSDGRVMINVRNEAGEKCREVSISDDGISGWQELKLDKQLQDPTCFGSLTRYDKSTILFSNVDDPEARNNISIKISHDDGGTWEEQKRFQNIGGYSDINVRDNKMICLLTEKEDENGKYIILYHSFNMRWLLS